MAFALFVIIFLLAACQKNESPNESLVFHYNQHNNITSLDPAYAKSQNNIWATHHLYSTLLSLDEQLNIQPSIAKSWKVDSKGTEYSFFIHQNITFHENECFSPLSTRKLVANDIVYSFSRLIDTTLNAPGSWIFKNRVTDEKPFSSIGDSIFILRLKEPFAPLLSLLTMQYCSIVPQEAIEFYGTKFHRNPVGTGPFKFKTWLDNQGLFIIKNENYFLADQRERSNLKGIRTSFIGERSLAYLELINNRLDFFSGLESSYINTALTPTGQLKEKYDSRIQFLKAPYLNFEYFGMNPDAPDAHPLLSDLNFRQALNYAIDREMMLRSLRNNVGKPADAGVITRGLPSYDPSSVTGYTFNRNKAITLIEKYGNDLIQQPLIISTSKDYLDLTTFVAKQWENIGLNVEIQVMESATLRNAMRNGDVGLFRASWIADYPDGENFLSMFFGQNPAPPNYTRYQNARYDSLYLEALKESDIDMKLERYQELDRIIVNDAPVIFLFYDEVALFANSRVDGLSLNGLNLLQVENIRINNE